MKNKAKFKVGEKIWDGETIVEVYKIVKMGYKLKWPNGHKDSYIYEFKWSHRYLKKLNSDIIREKLGIK